MLAHPNGAENGAQSPHRRDRLDHGDGHGFPGQHRDRCRTASRRWPRCSASTGTAPRAFGKWHETAAWETSVSGPFDRWPTHQGFDKFYGFIGGETNQWAPYPVRRGGPQVELPHDPNYHFLTDMTDKTIAWMRVPEGDHSGQAVLRLLRAGRYARAAPRAARVGSQVEGQVRSGVGQAPRRDPGAADRSWASCPPERNSRPSPRRSRTGTRSRLTKSVSSPGRPRSSPRFSR